MKELIDKTFVIGDKLKPIDLRIKTLDEHLRQSENFKVNRKIAAQYNKLTAECETAKNATGLFAKSKADKAHAAAQNFYETHRAEITLFQAAEKYLKDVLQSRYDPKKLPPIKKWQDERDTLRMEMSGLSAEYAAMKEEVKKVETIRRGVENVVRREVKTRTWGMEI
jgi:hypothetical protein